MNVPRINDESICIDQSSSSNKSDKVLFGSPTHGSDAVWKELTMSTEAELNAISEYNDLPSSKILTEKVISKLDEEYSKASLLVRSKKNSGHSPVKEVRPKKEPITVSFTMSNPLGFHVTISSLQLVARLKCKMTARVCTNVEAISIPRKQNMKSVNSKKWKFLASNEEFEIADFTRISSSSKDTKESCIDAYDYEDEPFFVVTRQSMGLDGNSEKVVRLSLCPITMGELEIIGVRCKIFNEIWIYHHFNLRETLLQNNFRGKL